MLISVFLRDAQLEGVCSDEQFAVVLSAFCRHLSQMGTDDSILVPGGWKNASGQRHHIFLTIVKQHSSYDMVVSNTTQQSGLLYHPHTAACQPKIK